MKNINKQRNFEECALVPLTQDELKLLLTTVKGMRTLIAKDPRVDKPFADLELHLEMQYNNTPWFKEGE